MRVASIVIRTEHAGSLEVTLAPEASRPLPRTKVSMRAERNAFHLDVEARDTSALRAALNSYIRWSSTALRMMEEAQG